MKRNHFHFDLNKYNYTITRIDKVHYSIIIMNHHRVSRLEIVLKVEYFTEH